MCVENGTNAWGKLDRPSKKRGVIKRAERMKPPRPGVRAVGFLFRGGSSRLNVELSRTGSARRPRPSDSGTGDTASPINTAGIGHEPHASPDLAYVPFCPDGFEDGFLARRGASKEGGHGETNEEPERRP